MFVEKVYTCSCMYSMSKGYVYMHNTYVYMSCTCTCIYMTDQIPSHTLYMYVPESCAEYQQSCVEAGHSAEARAGGTRGEKCCGR